jgi:RNA polymerase primary sigma factor
MITTPLLYNVSATSEIGLLTGLTPDGQTPYRENDAQHHVSHIDLLGCYLREIDRYPLLTEHEEQILAARVAQGDEQARTHLIEANLRLVVNIAKRYQGHAQDQHHMSLLDLIGYGHIGLVRAVERYDLSRGTRFTTCAVLYIKGAILRALDEQGRLVRLSAYRITQVRHLLIQEDELQHQLGDKPTTAELAAYTGKPLQVVEQLLAADQPPLSLDALLSPDEDATSCLLNMLAEEEHTSDPEQIVCATQQQQHTRQIVEMLLSGLTARERDIVRLRFGLDGAGERTIAAISQQIGLCPARVYQLLACAFEKMRTSEYAHVLRRAFVEQAS